MRRGGPFARSSIVIVALGFVAGCAGTRGRAPGFEQDGGGGQGGAGRGDGGGAAPAIDRSCVVTDLTQGPSTYTFEPATGTLTTRTYRFVIDPSAGTVEVSDGGARGWYWTIEFDAQGNPVHFEYKDGSITDWTNEYTDGRLTSVLVTPTTGNAYYPLESVTYRYEDATNPNVWTRAEHDAGADGTVDSTCVRKLEEGRPTSFDCTTPGQPLRSSAWIFSYESGRLVGADSDYNQWTGADGTPEIRYTWSYDDAGVITGFQQDGTYTNDDPHVDGVADLGETYSPGCAPLITEFPWLGHLGVEDGANPQAGTPQTWVPRPFAR